MDFNVKYTEDEVVLMVMEWLKENGWKIISYCLGHERGYDIVAQKETKKIIIEAKGARANINSPIKKRIHFDSGQLKDHLGKAIVKSLETKAENKDSIIAIAHPDEPYVRKVCEKTLNQLLEIDIITIWANKNKVESNRNING